MEYWMMKSNRGSKGLQFYFLERMIAMSSAVSRKSFGTFLMKDKVDLTIPKEVYLHYT